MKTLVIYYSFSGHTAKIAKKKAEKIGADLIEVKEAKKRSKLSAYTKGCRAAMKQKKVELAPFVADFDAYDKIYIGAPVWAGYPAPAINTLLDMIPEGKSIYMFLVSKSGQSSENCKKVFQNKLKKKGLTLSGFTDLRG